jgi:hypothetical protein
VFKDALGEAADHRQDFLDNFRHGKIARKKAHYFYQWLKAHYSDDALALAGSLTDEMAVFHHQWLMFCDEHVTPNMVEIIKVNNAKSGIVGFADTALKPDDILALGQPFYFKFKNALTGTVLALQSVDQDWYALPLSKQEWPSTHHDAHILPIDEQGSVAPLSEEGEAKRFRFVFIVSDQSVFEEFCANSDAAQKIQAMALSHFAATLTATKYQWSLFQIIVQFTR